MPTFKDYTMDQLQLPLSFEDFIPENHLVRVVNTVVDSLELKPLYDRYKEGGCPAYHPRMMLKVMIYSFTQKNYSSRQIAKALRENVNYMWISGGNKPDFRTINRFRLDMKDVIEDVFDSYSITIKIINSPKKALTANSKGVFRNAIIGGFAGALVTMLAVFVVSRLDVIIRNKEKIEQSFDIPILGLIPRFEQDN